MAIYCIPRQRIEKLKKVFSNLNSKNKIGDLVKKIERGEGVNLFSKQLPKEEAILLNTAFEKAIANEKSNAIANLLRKNIDVEYREKLLNKNQRKSIETFIENNIYPGKSKSEIIPIKEILEMSSKEQDALLKKTFGDNYKEKLSKDFKKAQQILTEKENKAIKEKIAKLKKQTEEKLAKAKDKADLKEKERILRDAKREKERILREKELPKKRQKQIIENFLKENKKKFVRKSVPIKDILRMSGEKRLDFLKTLMPAEKAIKLNKELTKKQFTTLEKELADKLENFKGLGDFNRFIDRKMDYYAGVKEGIELSDSEISRIMDETADISRTKKIMEDNPTDKNILEYGRTRQKLLETMEDFKINEKQTLRENVLSMLGVQRAVQLGIDFSTTLIQGAGIVTEPKFWKSVSQGFKNAFSKQQQKDMTARIMGDPLFDSAKNSGLRLPVASIELFKKEESVLFNKFKTAYKNPVVSKLAGGANEILGFFDRYVSSISQARFDIWKQMYQTAKDAGSDLSKKELEELSSMVNTISGSSNLGRFEKNAPELNVALFSARLLVTKLKMIASPATISAHYVKKSLGKTTVAEDVANGKRLRALLGISGAIAGMITVSKMSGKDVETDPKASNFGKMKVGNRMVDLTLGYGSYIRTTAQLYSGEKKTQEGIIKKTRPLTDEEKETEIRARNIKGAEIGRGDVVFSFMRGKIAAMPSLLWDVFTQETYSGKKPTIESSVNDKAKPLFVGEFWEILQDEEMSGAWKSFLIPFAGLGVGGYTQEPTDWTERETKEMEKFKKEKGDEELKKASIDYDKLVKPRIEEYINTDEYKNLSNKEKDSKLKSIRAKAKKEIFIEYDFDPKD